MGNRIRLIVEGRDKRVGEFILRACAAVVVNDGVACDLVNPTSELVFCAQTVHLRVNLEIDVLQGILGSVWVGDAPRDEAIQFGMEVGSRVAFMEDSRKMG